MNQTTLIETGHRTAFLDSGNKLVVAHQHGDGCTMGNKMPEDAYERKTCPAPDRLYVWAPGLDSGFDVPHATNVSHVTEGSGVGVLKEPPVNVSVVSTDNYSYNKCVDSLASEAQQASNLCFNIRVAERLEVVWETISVGQKLFVEVPNALLPEGSKESLVTLLEYAEEELDCTHVILCFKKARLDRANLIRTFMFLGFKLVTPGDPMVPNAEDLMFLVYCIDNYDSD